VAGEVILIVDDNPQNLKLARVLLAHEGYAVRTATRAEEAMQVLREARPRLLLVDVQLPGTDGLELTRRLKADPVYADLPVIALTAYAMKGDELRIRAAGCDGYIAKPLDARLLLSAIADRLGPPPAA
jgi:two-component system cell cycle response regulator DivK